MNIRYACGPLEDRQLLDDLRKSVKEYLPNTSFREYNVPWDPKGITNQNETHKRYLQQMGASFIHDVEERTLASLKRRPKLDDLQKDIFHHVSFANRRAKSFRGRDRLCSDVLKLISSENSMSYK